ESTPGTSIINQTFSLAPGQHQLIVEDIGAGTFQTLHKSAVNVTVLADGVFINSLITNSSIGPQVVLSAFARESSASIYQLQVWDDTTGKKLGESAPGSSTINQTYLLPSGAHQIIVEDISTGVFQAIHKATVTVNV